MTPAPLATAVRSLRHAIATTEEDPGDRQLLHDFLSQGDEAAFALLIRRHGAMVRGVCRRVLLHEQDAEDAFQAAFLVLAKKAASIRRGEALASWLHGVSYRIAMRAKRDAGRRRKHETRIPIPLATAPAADEASWREVQAALDEEVERLPPACRSAFVLCCLQRLSQADAARRLGVKEGTVSSQLTRARKRLRAALARRGISLSAVLAGLALADGARAAVPASSARATARSAARFAAGDMVDGLSAKAVTLAEGALTIMFATRLTLATLLLLVTGLAGALALGLQRQAAATEAPPAVTRSTQPPTPAKDKTDVVEVKGRVLDPKGKGFAGARVRLWTGGGKAKETPVRATTDAEGRFRFSARKTELGPGAKVVVTAAGQGPDWVEVPSPAAADELTLQLGQEVPLEGRILNLEGWPVAGAAIEVLRVEKPSGKDLSAWVAAWLDSASRYPKVPRLSAAALGKPRSVTGRSGRFTLHGFGREQAVYVRVSGDHLAQTVFWILTRPGTGPAPEIMERGYGAVYLARFEHVVEPNKPVIGTVRDKRTGKPLAGILVARIYVGEAQGDLFTTTDAHGRYRLAGPKRSTYLISVSGKPGLPYCGQARHQISDTPRLDPVKVDFRLERGLEISGKVLDKLTGKPVRGRVMYFPTRDNPFGADYTTADGPLFDISRWGDIGPDGSFTVLGVPGPGVLAVLAGNSAVYPPIDNSTEIVKLGADGYPGAPAHLAVKIDPREDNPKSQTCGVLKLTPGGKRHGTATDAAGKALAGVRVVGLIDDVTPQKLAGSTFTVVGLQSRRERALVFLHEGKKLGAVVGVSTAAANPVTVKLQPLGSLKGRLLDANGKPLPKLRVVVRLSLDGKRYSNLPEEYDGLGGVFNLIRGAWRGFTGREATTDKGGRFRVEGLIPSEKYEFFGGPGDIERQGGVTHRKLGLTVMPGQEKDLGDLKQTDPDRP